MDVSKSKDKPALLDIVRIDSRWAQVAGNPRSDGTMPVRFLDDRSVGTLDFGIHELTKQYRQRMSLGFAIMDYKVELTKGEIANVRWGSEEAEHPELKLEVRVFGEYEREQYRRLKDRHMPGKPE